MTELQKNTRGHVESFFKALSSKTELINYKNTVPFVHIPDELFAQWENFSTNKQIWYREIWTSEEWKNLLSFDQVFRELLRKTPESEKDLDVPEILETTIWKEIMEKAKMYKLSIF